MSQAVLVCRHMNSANLLALEPSGRIAHTTWPVALNFCVILIVAPEVLRHGEVGLIRFLGLVLGDLPTTLQVRLDGVTISSFTGHLPTQRHPPFLLRTQFLPLAFTLLGQQLFMRFLLIAVAVTTAP